MKKLWYIRRSTTYPLKNFSISDKSVHKTKLIDKTKKIFYKNENKKDIIFTCETNSNYKQNPYMTIKIRRNKTIIIIIIITTTTISSV